MEQHAMPQARTVVKRPYLALMGLFIAAFTGLYSETALNIAIPNLSDSFGISTALTQWLVIGYMLVIGIVLPLTSYFMKCFSIKQLSIFAHVIFIVGALISGFAPNFPIALVGRLIQGIGTGLILPMLMSVILEIIPPHKLGAAMGVASLIILVAPAVGPTIAGFLISFASWRWIFFSFTLLLVAALFFTCRYGISPFKLTHPPLDVLSVVLSILGFSGLVSASGLASSFGWLSVETLLPLIAALVILALYVKRQLMIQHPILDMRVFKTWRFSLGMLALMLNFGIILSAMFVIPYFCQNSLGMSASATGLLIMPGGVLNAIVGFFGGRLYDKVGARKPACVGFMLSAIAALMLLFVHVGTSPWYILVAHLILMAGGPLAMAPAQTFALSSLPPHLGGDGSTLSNTLQQVLGAICTAVATSLLLSGIAKGDAAGLIHTQSVALGSRYGFTFTLALAIAGFLLATRLKKVPQKVATQKPQSISLMDLVKTDIYALSPENTVLDALKLFTEHHISGAPILDVDARPVGFLSDGTVLKYLGLQDPKVTTWWSMVSEGDNKTLSKKIEEVIALPVLSLATLDVISVDTTTSIEEACKLLSEKHLKKVPVLENGRAIAILNRADITQYVVQNELLKK